MPSAVVNGSSNDSADKWPLRPYSRPPQTKENLEWADLVKIDLTHFDNPTERFKLAGQLDYALKNVGFWFATGHGITDEEIMRMLQIGDAFFRLPMEEKAKVPIDLANDLNWGYRLPTRKLGPSGLLERVETYEIQKDIPEFKDVATHDLFKAYWPEIAAFNRKLFERVAVPLYTLIAIVLELPEDYIVQMNAYDKPSDDYLRLMLHHARPKEYYEATANYNIGAHADRGSLTILAPQTVASLQILSKDGTFKNVPFVPGAFTINCGEILSHVTKDYVKSTIHRVAQPPTDQLHLERLGLIYLAQFNDDVRLRPVPSPLLKRLGLLSDDELDGSQAYPTAAEYVRERMRARHHVKEFPMHDPNAKFTFQGLTAQNHFD